MSSPHVPFGVATGRASSDVVAEAAGTGDAGVAARSDGSFGVTSCRRRGIIAQEQDEGRFGYRRDSFLPCPQGGPLPHESAAQVRDLLGRKVDPERRQSSLEFPIVVAVGHRKSPLLLSDLPHRCRPA
jgi:hypothetical protein